MKLRKKPVVVDATQWFKNGDHPLDYAFPVDGFENGELRTFTGDERRARGWEGSVVRYFRRPDVDGASPCRHCTKTMDSHGWIDTLEGGHIVCPGDFVITGVKGEHYPCKPDICDATYVNDDEPAPTDGALKFLLSMGEGRIVSSGDLTRLQIAEAQARGRFYVEPGGGLGWAVVPWDLTTAKDRKREADYFSRNNMLVH